MSSDQCPGKNEWPELVGENGPEAANIVERENPNVEAHVVLQGSIVTADFRCDRVRVWVNTNGVVYRSPRIG
ncbi:hypothetical protein BVRB_8g194010 [Beta vulgaris subsp. vulgaris]|nr:hypothetical protein BVRB_8g194010 [Beta vulgaris subsp. vulgaris]